MLRKLHNRLWIRPQLFFTALINSTCDCNSQYPKDILNFKGVLMLGVAVVDLIFCELTWLALGRADKIRWEDTKRASLIEDYIEAKGLAKANLSSADKYYYTKTYIENAKDVLENDRELENHDKDRLAKSIKEAEDSMKEFYEEAIILELAGVE